MKLDRILVPLDGSPLAEMALPATMALLRDRPAAAVILLRATQATTPRSWIDPIEAQVEVVGEAEVYLKSVADRLRDEEPDRTVTTSVWYGPPARAIVDAADARGAQLIVMSTHGRSGLRRMVLGSVAESVLRTTTVPVFLVPPSERAVPDPAALVAAHNGGVVDV